MTMTTRRRTAVRPIITHPFRFPMNPTHPGLTGTTPAVLDEGVRLPDPDPLPKPPPADWRTVPMPEAIAALPVDRRGFPVFHTVLPDGGVPDDGKVDFRILNMERHIESGLKGLCSICGGQLDYWLWLLGGPMCVQNRIFGDGPMHEDCARYAMRVCPFLVNAKREYSTRYGEGLHHDPNVSLTRPERLVLVMTRHARLIPAESAKPVFAIAKPVSVEWYRPDGSYVCRTRPTRFAQ